MVLELLKIPRLIDCYRDLILPGLLGIMKTHRRETYQPTSIVRWDRGNFNGSLGGELRTNRKWVITPVIYMGWVGLIHLELWL